MKQYSIRLIYIISSFLLVSNTYATSGFPREGEEYTTFDLPNPTAPVLAGDRICANCFSENRNIGINHLIDIINELYSGWARIETTNGGARRRAYDGELGAGLNIAAASLLDSEWIRATQGARFSSRQTYINQIINRGTLNIAQGGSLPDETIRTENIVDETMTTVSVVNNTLQRENVNQHQIQVRDRMRCPQGCALMGVSRSGVIQCYPIREDLDYVSSTPPYTDICQPT